MQDKEKIVCAQVTNANTLYVKPKFRKVLDLSDFLIPAPLLTGGDKNVAKTGLSSVDPFLCHIVFM